MARLLAELDDLVLDRRAVARSDSFDVSAIERRFVQVAPYHVVDRLVRIADEAFDLRAVYRIGLERERNGALVAGLPLELSVVDRAAVQPWRSPGLQPAHAELNIANAGGKPDR